MIAPHLPPPRLSLQCSFETMDERAATPRLGVAATTLIVVALGIGALNINEQASPPTQVTAAPTAAFEPKKLTLIATHHWLPWARTWSATGTVCIPINGRGRNQRRGGDRYYDPRVAMVIKRLLSLTMSPNLSERSSLR
jgi:hypothetical protein